MAQYACFQCGKKISDNLLGKRIRCPYCSSKILYKPRETTTKVLAV